MNSKRGRCPSGKTVQIGIKKEINIEEQSVDIVKYSDQVDISRVAAVSR